MLRHSQPLTILETTPDLFQKASETAAISAHPTHYSTFFHSSSRSVLGLNRSVLIIDRHGVVRPPDRASRRSCAERCVQLQLPLCSKQAARPHVAKAALPSSGPQRLACVCCCSRGELGQHGLVALMGDVEKSAWWDLVLLV